jgi:hypothetical protein
MDEFAIRMKLLEMLCTIADAGHDPCLAEDVEALFDGVLDVRTAATFEDAGVLSTNAGLVLKMRDGSEFQITVVKSK